jgi:REP-associated tyrosine transposase
VVWLHTLDPVGHTLRQNVAGGIYHVTARGNARQAIFLDELDYVALLRQLSETVVRFAWRCHSFCLIPNHYHLLLETPEPNLSRGMLLLNGAYARRFNGRHERAGHVFQGPYRARLVARDEHLLELCRYIALNPVRAGLCDDPAAWAWSSYRAIAGLERRPPYLCVDWVHSLFGSARAFRAFVQGDLQAV